MPEGHTLHRLARRHHAWFAAGPVEVSSPQGAFGGADIVNGQVLDSTEAYGKHLFYHWDNGQVGHVHLGLFGKFFDHQIPAPSPRQTVRMRLANDAYATDLVGATICSLITPDEREAILARLGPDPLRTDANPDLAWRALQRRKTGIGAALMDQKVLAGVGNVYRAEVLFVHGVHPELPARDLPEETWRSMWATLVEWMRYGARYGRIVTTDSAEIGRPRSKMTRDQSLHVYKRAHCRRCGTEIRRWEIANRWSYACETCQTFSGSGSSG